MSTEESVLPRRNLAFAMRGLWTSVSAVAVLAASAGAVVAAPGVIDAASLSVHPVTIEIADANRAPAGTLFVGIANPGTQRAFAFGDDDTQVSGHLAVQAPPALSLATGDVTSLGDVVVAQTFAPGAAVEFAYGDTAATSPQRFGAGGLYDQLFLFESPASTPFGSVTGGGSYGGLRFALGDLRFRVGAAARDSLDLSAGTALSPVPSELLASAGEDLTAQSFSASVDWQITDWASVGVTGTQTSERGTVLGRMLTGPGAVSSGADTSALSVSARIGFGDGWVTTANFDSGMTQLDVRPAFQVNGGALYSQAYGLAIAKEGLFGDDAIGFSVSRPLQSGGVVFGDRAFAARALALANMTNGGAQQSDIQLGYVTTFLDGSLALQANAGYQMNANGERGQDAITAAARARIDF